MINEIKVGPQTNSDGAQVVARGAKTGEAVVIDGHARYQEAVLRGNVWLASTQAGVALTTTLSSTATGIILTNPAGSGKNIVVLDLLLALTTAPAGIASIGLAASVNPVAAAVTHTTPLTVRNAMLGLSGTAVGLVDSSATLPATPVCVRAIGGGPVATGSVTAPFIRDEIAGSLVLIPGTAINTFCLTTAISAICTIVWEEVPV